MISSLHSEHGDIPFRGTYLLVLTLHDTVTIGKLGTFQLDGNYAYIGSAHGQRPSETH